LLVIEVWRQVPRSQRLLRLGAAKFQHAFPRRSTLPRSGTESLYWLCLPEYPVFKAIFEAALTGEGWCIMGGCGRLVHWQGSTNFNRTKIFQLAADKRALFIKYAQWNWRPLSRRRQRAVAHEPKHGRLTQAPQLSALPEGIILIGVLALVYPGRCRGLTFLERDFHVHLGTMSDPRQLPDLGKVIKARHHHLRGGFHRLELHCRAMFITLAGVACTRRLLTARRQRLQR
jgi:hypothetical protein